MSHSSTASAGPAQPQSKLPFGRLVAYAALQLPLAMTALPVVLNVAHYYGEVLKLSLAIMGPVLMASRVIDAIQDPLIGLLSDRLTRYRFGRMFLVAAALPLLMGGFFMMFDPPAMFQPGSESYIEHPWLLAAWLFVSLLLVHLGYSGVSISYHAHGAELTDDYNERTKVTVAREVFGLSGMMVAVVLPTLLVSKFGEAAGHQWLGILFLPIALCFAIPTLFFSPPSVHGEVKRAPGVSVMQQFLSPFANPLYRRLLAIFFVNGSAIAIAVSVMMFYAEHVLAATKLQVGMILLTYFLCGAASVPLWMFLSRRFGKATAWFVGIVLSMVAMAVAGMAGQGEIGWFIAATVFTGIAIGADYGLPPSILADVINAKEGKHGRGAAGTYFGMWALATKLATAAGAAASLPIVAWLGFNPSRGLYDQHALFVVYIVLPIVVKGIAGLMVWFMRIEPERPSVHEVLTGRR